MYRCPVNFICWQVERCCLLPAAISPLRLEIPTRVPRLTARYMRNNPAAWRNPRVVTQPPFDLFNVNSEHRGFGPPVMAVGCGHQFNGHKLATRTGYANPAVTAQRPFLPGATLIKPRNEFNNREGSSEARQNGSREGKGPVKLNLKINFIQFCAHEIYMLVLQIFGQIKLMSSESGSLTLQVEMNADAGTVHCKFDRMHVNYRIPINRSTDH
ncbi:hypothetical protein ALC53_01628 [Atta colombica]|uniref:Uncharacterized protein n=1 Tax=Atta colombica TaxID=520822 RepID=A0A195BTF2_9HYME|nr:hypothetical protein ALC53_01628 [Atta colombica]